MSKSRPALGPLAPRGVFDRADQFAVDITGAVPFAIRGTAKGPEGVSVQMIVRKDSAFKKLADLKGKKVAHTSPSSNSGNLAPRAMFPALGLTPDKDYQVVPLPGKHDQSVLGVKSGDYDAAPVASDVLQHMIERGVVKPMTSPRSLPARCSDRLGRASRARPRPQARRKNQGLLLRLQDPARDGPRGWAATASCRPTTRRTGNWFARSRCRPGRA